MSVLVRRIYDDVPNGRRVLVDRIWPRGVSKEEADLDDWAKDVAPSNELRTWYGHDPERWEEFRQRYLDELDDDVRSKKLGELVAAADGKRLILLTSTKAVDHSHATVLAELIRDRTA